ncbi:MAG: glycosyltransferase family 2 protein [Candidatus Paceibacterota bacterium]
MSADALAYPFIFIAIFFESFVLVTLLSKPARDARARTKSTTTPSVAVIVPCRNEGETVATTTESLLALDYPKDKLQIILVDNASTDNTPAVMARYANNPQVRVLQAAERGKHNAVNAGIAATDAEFIGCLDADSFVEPDALHEIIPCFDRSEVAAVTAAMSIHRPRTVVEHMQNAEYSFGITMRHAMASINGLYVTPGPFSFYRHSVIRELGGFRYGHQTEDMEMALRIQRAGYEIENAPRARVYTKAPRTIPSLIRQRTRWTNGFLRNMLGEYRTLIFNRKYGVLGMMVLPIALTAIVSTVALFLLSITQFVLQAIRAIEIRLGIPLSYTLAPHYAGFDWFYFPVDTFIFLGFITLVVSVGLIAYGRHLSKTSMRLAPSLLSYLLYGLVAPLWLIRSTANVAFGKHQTWK